MTAAPPGNPPAARPEVAAGAHIALDRSPGADGVAIRLAGRWHLDHSMPTLRSFEALLAEGSRPTRITLDASGLAGWDSSLVSFVLAVGEYCHARGIECDRSTLPAGVRRLAELAETVPESADAQAPAPPATRIERVGAAVLAAGEGAGEYVEFLGLLVLALGNFVTGRARTRNSDLLEVVENCGARALGIVTLISYLVGVILAFMGAVQLQQFGAAIYVADLVGIGMVREMGAMMTGIIMAGRTGAAFAAELSSMKVTQEIDAITTMGISPIEFLAVPRVVGLVLMMPLLCLYADFVGILGGATVGVTMLGLSLTTYMHETVAAVTVGALLGGIFKATVYGMLIALAGCYEGFRCGDSSSAVGLATTAAVVNGIVLIVIACGLFAVMFNVLGI
ncbi:MAG TPA: ABC transporter permease [Candidatus Binataceae bacterium]|nr:ABC transporter permease [Candidatus Binataceae bacterium]